MALKLSLLSIQVAFLIFLAMTAAIRRPREEFGWPLVEGNAKTKTVSDYDDYGNNSIHFRRFYVSALFIKLMFCLSLVSMLVFALTLIGNLFTVDTLKAKKNWANKQPSLVLRIQDTKSKEVLARGPLSSTFIVMADGKVYPIEHSGTGVALVLLSKANPSLITTKSAADFLGVISLLLVIACFVLWFIDHTFKKADDR